MTANIEDLVLWQKFMGWCHETGKQPGFGSSVNEFLELHRSKARVIS